MVIHLFKTTSYLLFQNRKHENEAQNLAPVQVLALIQNQALVLIENPGKRSRNLRNIKKKKIKRKRKRNHEIKRKTKSKIKIQFLIKMKYKKILR